MRSLVLVASVVVLVGVLALGTGAALLYYGIGSEVNATEVDAAEPASSRRCPPCGMVMPDDCPTTELHGMQWALCSERCKELVQESADDFIEFAIAPVSPPVSPPDSPDSPAEQR
jgi:hypothetical protein